MHATRVPINPFQLGILIVPGLNGNVVSALSIQEISLWDILGHCYTIERHKIYARTDIVLFLFLLVIVVEERIDDRRI